MGNKPSNTIFYEYFGKKMSLNDISKIEGINNSSLAYNIKNGKSLDEAIYHLKNELNLDNEDSKFCHKCKKLVINNEMTKRGTYCKKCHSNNEKERRSKMSSDEIKENSRKSYKKYRQKYAEITDEDEMIRLWVLKWRTANGKTRHNGRKNISFDFLFLKCKQSLKVFPYMTFKNILEEGTKRAFFASVDRINPASEYSESNIVVVPLWLNSAKLDMTVDEFKVIIANTSIDDIYKTN